MLPPLVRRLSRLAAELAVLIAFWWAGGWLAKAIGLPLPGGVVGLAALLLLFASGLLRPAWLQAGAGLLQRGLDVAQALLGLRLDAVGDAHGAVVETRGARDEHPVALHHGARVADLLFEGRARGNERARHGQTPR